MKNCCLRENEAGCYVTYRILWIITPYDFPSTWNFQTYNLVFCNMWKKCVFFQVQRPSMIENWHKVWSHKNHHTPVGCYVIFDVSQQIFGSVVERFGRDNIVWIQRKWVEAFGSYDEHVCIEGAKICIITMPIFWDIGIVIMHILAKVHHEMTSSNPIHSGKRNLNNIIP